MSDFSLLKVSTPYEKKKISLRLEIDDKTFPPCNAKEVEKWSHLMMKTLKYIVHVDVNGIMTIREVK